MNAVAEARPENPVEWLAYYLLKNNTAGHWLIDHFAKLRYTLTDCKAAHSVDDCPGMVVLDAELCLLAPPDDEEEPCCGLCAIRQIESQSVSGRAEGTRYEQQGLASDGMPIGCAVGQGMGFICGVLLMYMGEDDAFLMLISLLENYRMAGLFMPNLPLLNKYFFQLQRLLEINLPLLHEHLTEQGVEPTMYASQWFMTVCIYNFPFSTVVRVWDIFLAEGVKIIFRIALALLKLNQEALLHQSFEQILQTLKQAPSAVESEVLIKTALNIKLKNKTLKDIELLPQHYARNCAALSTAIQEKDKKDADEKKETKEDKPKEVKKDRRDVVVHPIVLLGVVDHYNRVAKGTTKRVVGTLVGEVSDYSLHITNCFAVPFEEDPRDPQVWFLDHNFHESMFAMFKKVNTKERIVGWYSTGPKIKPSDLSIHELYRRYCPEPVLVVMDVQPKDLELPMEAYYSVQEQTSDEVFKRTFWHVQSTVGAFEAEEVGVEHLLRDIKNASASTLAVRVGDKIGALKGLAMRLREISQYLSQVVAGKLPMNQEIIYQLQEIFNLMPDQDSEELVRSLATETNDMMLALYLGSMLRSTVALHNLINNKMKNKKVKAAASVHIAPPPFGLLA
ncbi:26S proteasome non-ATPase regulatory subunit 7 homolog A (26S proteasome regulatory subunit RPN8a) (AtRPN8a) (Protein ASYMMETRIC LEAVES ENHANCER 3) (Protein MOV34) (AtMOV34) [Durusdinium trenchii]|uniref:26S proteasome non-ATPase regulatory subunit 7 homolog A (26S proteasome regulatory subunit RPN8a) (AtRPN8a) (Protein ASYMMETRIC LEAVES ENHANCER 3) (Protein MOV34) (AtMOV34) n=1 Tax=Durusdinium trenchii TaxID=1381693 RepID=A0ABP0I7U7_9DINO